MWVGSYIEDLVDFHDAKRIPLSGTERSKQQGSYRYYGAQGVIDHIDDYIFDGEYLLVTEDGENLNTRKQPIAFKVSGKFWVNNHAHVVSAKKGVSTNTFLLYLLNNVNLAPYITGAAQPKLSQANLRKITVSVPSLSVQRKIADILSAYDDLIENNNKRIKILEEMAQKLYKEWFVDFKFPGHENTKFVESELGLIPDGWEVKFLKQFGTIHTGKTPNTRKIENFGNFMPFIKTPDMHEGVFCIKTSECLSEIGAMSQKNKILPPDSLCVSCIGTAGVVSITTEESQSNQQINSIVIDEIKKREFLYFALCGLKNTIMQYGSTGATMVNLSKGKFEKLKVVCPKDIIIYQYNNLTKSIFDNIKQLIYSNDNLCQTRDLLLPRLISGELSVENTNTLEDKQAYHDETQLE